MQLSAGLVYTLLQNSQVLGRDDVQRYTGVSSRGGRHLSTLERKKAESKVVFTK